MARLLTAVVALVDDCAGPAPADGVAADRWRVERIRLLSMVESRLDAEVYATTADLAHSRDGGPIPGRKLAAAEIGSALRLGPRSAARRVDDALTMRELPQLRGLLGGGLLDGPRVRVIMSAMQSYGLDPFLPADDPQAGLWSEVEARVAARAPSRTAGQLKADVRRALLELAPDLVRAKAERARDGAFIETTEAPNGMAWLEGAIPVQAAATMNLCLDAMADAYRDTARKAGAHDGLTHRQRRVAAFEGIFQSILDGRPMRFVATSGAEQDAEAVPEKGPARMAEQDQFEDAMTFVPEGLVADHEGVPAEPESVQPSPWPREVPAFWQPPDLPVQQRRRLHLVITASLTTLLGLNDLPGELARAGAVHADLARELARQAGTVKLLVSPPVADECACAPSVYRPSSSVVRDVIDRNQHCRFPGCTFPGERCDVDHVVPFDHKEPGTGGPTCEHNLIPLCRGHHQLKTLGGWCYRPADLDEGHPPGTLEWISPLGQTIHSYPPDAVLVTA